MHITWVETLQNWMAEYPKPALSIVLEIVLNIYSWNFQKRHRRAAFAKTLFQGHCLVLAWTAAPRHALSVLALRLVFRANHNCCPRGGRGGTPVPQNMPVYLMVCSPGIDENFTEYGTTLPFWGQTKSNSN